MKCDSLGQKLAYFLLGVADYRASRHIRRVGAVACGSVLDDNDEAFNPGTVSVNTFFRETSRPARPLILRCLRIARFVAEGLPHHVTQRGNGRQQVFRCPEDQALYEDLLQR